jgi:hypothetical protein
LHGGWKLKLYFRIAFAFSKIEDLSQILAERDFMLRAFLILPFLFSVLMAHAADETLSSFSVTSPNVKTLKKLAEHFGLEHWHGNSVEIIATQSQIPLLLSLAPTAKMTEADTQAAAQARLFLYSLRVQTAGERYHSFDEVQKWMNDVASNHPEWASVINYGTSAKGRPLLALRLHKSVEKKPTLMITAATHGDELITTEVLMNLIDQLIAGDGQNERYSSILQNHDLYFVPVVNPDGFTATRRYEGNRDPNRSYPWPEDESNIPSPSIAGLIQLFNTIQPVGTLDFHAYGGMVMYPWAYTYNAPDSKFDVPFLELTRTMSQSNGYAYGQISQVIYIAPGSSADYYFWKSQSTSIAVEMGSDKIPDPSEIPLYANEQAEGLWMFIESFKAN